MHTGTVGTPLPPSDASPMAVPTDFDVDTPTDYPRSHLSLDSDPGLARPLPTRRGASKPRSPRRTRRTGRAKTAASTALYRYYDAEDVLLYVGITGDLVEREVEHIRDSTWMDFAARSTIERFPTRAETEDAERDAIRDEAPLFNIAHNNTPGLTRRLVDYLVEHDRRDLLMPAVSRG